MRGRPVDKRWIRRIGRPVLWEKAILHTERRYDGSVPFFAGSPSERGYQYEEPVQILALLTSDNRGKTFAVQGSWEQGTALMTFPADLDIGPEDRVTFLDMPVRQELELKRGTGTQDTFPTALYVNEVLRIQDSIQNYISAQDYQFTASNERITGVDWSGAQQAPTSGQTYSLLCLMQPVWIVDEQSMIRSFGRNQLLKRARLRRDDKRTKS